MSMIRNLPLLMQERDETCALACHRMVLAGRAIVVAETDLEQRLSRKEAGGTAMVDLQRLAGSFGLAAEIQEANVRQISNMLLIGCDVIAYINRAVFDLHRLTDLTAALHSGIIHAVVPVRINKRHIQFHDPLVPATIAKTIRRFEAAQKHVRSICLVVPE